jgi:neutral amino acid transport system permease protein
MFGSLSSVLTDSLQAMVGRDAIVYAIAAMGINLHFGYTGLLNLGQVGWMAVGSYGMSIAVLSFGWPLWLAMLFGFACSLGLSLLLGVPTLRLRADYLAIVTVAAGELVRVVARAAALSEVTGGSSGLPGRGDPPYNSGFYSLNPFSEGAYQLGPVKFNERQLFFFCVGWTVVALVALIMVLLVRSPWGRVLRAIREDEDAASALGKDAYRFKMQSLVLGGMMGSLAGMMLALESGSVQPDSYSPPVTYFAWTCLILGGVARVAGPIVGAMVFWALLSFSSGILTEVLRAGGLFDDWFGFHLQDSQTGQIRFVLVGVGLAVLMIFRPQGFLGDKKEMALDAR